jgi:hypothetical protein
MSLAMHVQGIRNKNLCKFDRSIVWDIFGSKCTESYRGYDLWYDDGKGGFLYLSEDELIDGIGIQSPSEAAIRDLYAVARQVPSTIDWNGAFFVADRAFLKHLPFWTTLLPKPVRVARSADELLELLAQG